MWPAHLSALGKAHDKFAAKEIIWIIFFVAVKASALNLPSEDVEKRPAPNKLAKHYPPPPVQSPQNAKDLRIGCIGNVLANKISESRQMLATALTVEL